MSKRARWRYHRTVFLAMACLGTLIWAAVTQFDIPPADIYQYFLYSGLGVILIVVLAALTLGVWLLLKKLIGSLRDKG